MQVELGCLDRLMTEPECDDGEVGTALKQRHRRGMTQGIRRDPAAR